MKRIALISALLLACMQLSAQTEPQTKTPVDEYVARYNRQVKNVGYSGVGVETILDRWEADYPEDVNPKVGRINYLLDKSQSFEVVKSVDAKYLGKKPIATLKDENGADVNYFNDVVYEEETFAECQKLIDSYIKKYPNELRYRLCKITTLLDYEKEYPDMTEGEISALIDERGTAWTLDGVLADQETFLDVIQEYCFSLYSVGTPASYESFYRISQRMSGCYPKNTSFIDNMGSYWLVYHKNYKKAISTYNKALKIDPEDQVALRNKKTAEKMLAASKKK